MDSREKCLFINNQIPENGLFIGEKVEIHPDSNTPWRISPDPFWISQDELDWFDTLGTHLFRFYQICNLLYSQSVRSIQPHWVASYLDQGKPETVIQHGRMNRFKSQLPGVIRPDVIPTQDGMVLTELDSVPGGIGFTANLATHYTKLGYDIIGGDNGMMLGFTKMIRFLTKKSSPTLAIVVSDEAGDYRTEMDWFASALKEFGLNAHTVKPDEILFTEEGLYIHGSHSKLRIDLLYRFFELFDLPNIPKVELMLYGARKRKVVMTPPPKAYLEEKSLFALFCHPVLQPFWRRELGKTSYLFLQKIIPKTWLLDNRSLPPHAVIPEIEIGNLPVTDWRQISSGTQRERELVLKPSGFSELAWGSRGVAIGHDLSTEDWRAAVENALSRFEETPYVLQKFHKATRIQMSHYDFDSGELRSMAGRALLRPYYFTSENSIQLAGIQATVCPADKKILHGMVDSIIVPVALKNS